jgi:hypothetical protein
MRTLRVSPASQRYSGGATAFSPDGRYVAAGNANGTICILRLAERGKLPELTAKP